ncbi:hypothetical protein ENBRE01_2069 [Enteropsectra breve]|nr:hypothetical protein ENBRE01_2069 [Enteropsectra breve]
MQPSSNLRKQRKKIDSSIFEQIKRLYKSKTKQELAEITGVGISAITNCIRKIETCDAEEAYFSALYKKPGAKRRDKRLLHTEIRNIVGNDNSLTQKGVQEKLSLPFSLPQLSREFKAMGLKRKRLKKSLKPYWQYRAKMKKTSFVREYQVKDQDQSSF